ncbi:MAG: hypothetical protein LBV29_09350, partial [Azoarcus sp.]|nr:hypothetical protein [Azoarcus sp.]
VENTNDESRIIRVDRLHPWPGRFIASCCHSRHSRWGWVFYLASNAALIVYAYKGGAHGILAQQTGFLLINLIGVHRWFAPEPTRV